MGVRFHYDGRETLAESITHSARLPWGAGNGREDWQECLGMIDGLKQAGDETLVTGLLNAAARWRTRLDEGY